MNRIRFVAPGIVCCLMGAGLVAALNSCTIVLPAVVSRSAGSDKAGWPAGRVVRDQRVTLHMADDSVIKGRLAQARPIKGAAYREWHEQTFPAWAERWGLCLKPGEPAELRLRSGDRLRGTLAEVDQGSVTITVQGNDRRVPLEEWERLDMGGGCSVAPSSLASIPGQDWPLPPLLLAIREHGGLITEARSDSVVQTTVHASERSVSRALLAGLLIDGTLAFAYALSQIEIEPELPPEYEGSCPVIYTVGPEGPVLEMEAFAAAIAPGLQRSDLARLDHVPVGLSPQTLDVHSRPKEIQYVDALLLLAIDHEPGSEVLPTSTGSLVAVTSRVSPVSATDIWGRAVRNLVLEADSIPWISNPFHRPRADSTVDRDLLEVRFQRDAFADRAFLILRAQNTSWGYRAFREIIAELRDHMETLSRPDSEVGSAGARMVIEEVAGTEIQLWDGTKWIDGGRIWPVGPIVPRLMAHELDLTSVPEGEDLRIRFVSTPGMWTLDYVAAATGGRPVTEIREIEPSVATDESGRNVRGEMGTVDGRYYIMPDENAKANVSFEIPSAVEGKQRTLMLSATGWYQVLPDRDPTPGLDMIGMVGNPAAVSRFIGKFFERMAREVAVAQ